MNALVSLDYVVASIINAMKADKRDYVYLKQLVIEGYTELCLFHLNNVKIAYLEIGDDNIVAMPNDFQYYSKIGVVIGGKIYTLTRDDTMALSRDMSCGDDVAITYTSTNPTDTSILESTQRGGSLKYFADTGGKNIGRYRIDEERREIALRDLIGHTHIVLEYASVPIEVGEDTMIKRYAVPALRAYVMEKAILYDVRIRDNEKARRAFDFDKELYKLRMLENQLTADEYMDIINATRQQSPKR